MATKNLTLDTFERTVNGDGIIVYTQPGVLAPLQLDQHIVRKDPLMCSRITCSACGKPTWTGCG